MRQDAGPWEARGCPCMPARCQAGLYSRRHMGVGGAAVGIQLSVRSDHTTRMRALQRNFDLRVHSTTPVQHCTAAPSWRWPAHPRQLAVFGLQTEVCTIRFSHRIHIHAGTAHAACQLIRATAGPHRLRCHGFRLRRRSAVGALPHVVRLLLLVGLAVRDHLLHSRRAGQQRTRAQGWARQHRGRQMHALKT